jgi:DNA mismatch repair protein MSH6
MRRVALDRFQSTLFEVFDAHRATWLAVIRVLAEVDCLISLSKASAALETPACRPILEESSSAFIDFKQLRHPALLLKGDFIPNDVELGSNGRDNIVLLTGELSMVPGQDPPNVQLYYRTKYGVSRFHHHL